MIVEVFSVVGREILPGLLLPQLRAIQITQLVHAASLQGARTLVLEVVHHTAIPFIAIALQVHLLLVLLRRGVLHPGALRPVQAVIACGFAHTYLKCNLLK